MVSEFHVEGNSKRTIQHVKAGLEAALYEFDIDVPDEDRSGFRDENVKIQKFVYRIIEDYDLPIIHTWYRYGQFEPYNALRPKHIQPRPLDDPGKAISENEYTDRITREDIKGYFLESDLEEVWNQPLFQFLEENYKSELAPPEYQDTYLANLHILRILDEIRQEDDLGDNAATYADQLQAPSLDLRYELESSNRFGEEVQKHIEDYLDELQSGLIALSSVKNPKATQIQAD